MNTRSSALGIVVVRLVVVDRRVRMEFGQYIVVIVERLVEGSSEYARNGVGGEREQMISRKRQVEIERVVVRDEKRARDARRNRQFELCVAERAIRTCEQIAKLHNIGCR